MEPNNQAVNSPLPVSDVASLVFLFWLGDFSFSCTKQTKKTISSRHAPSKRNYRTIFLTTGQNRHCPSGEKLLIFTLVSLHIKPSIYVDPVEVDAPVGSCSRWDEPIPVLARRRHRRLGGCQVTDHVRDFLQVVEIRRRNKVKSHDSQNKVVGLVSNIGQNHAFGK